MHLYISEYDLKQLIRQEIAAALMVYQDIVPVKYECNHCYCIGNNNQSTTTAAIGGGGVHKMCCKCGGRMATFNFTTNTTYYGMPSNFGPYTNDSAVQGKLF